MLKNDYDVIVIGAGLSGLSSSAYLSRKGLKVLLVEKLNQLGGFVNTFKRGNYTFDATTHQLTGFKTKNYVEEIVKLLGINIEYVKSKNLLETIYFKENEIKKRYILPVGYNNIKNYLISEFPDSKKEIEDYFELIEKVGKDTFRIKAVSRDPKKHLIDAICALWLKDGKNILKKLGIARYKNLVNYVNKTYSEMESFVTKEELKWIFGTYWPYLCYDLEDICSVFYALVNYAYYCDSPYQIKGGSLNLINDIVNSIKNSKGEILTNKEVTKILIENNKAVGIQTNDGEKYKSKVILSAINTEDVFFKMIGKENLPLSYVEHLENLKYTESAFMIYLGLPFRIEDYGFEAPSTFFNSTMNPSESYKMVLQDSTFLDRKNTFFMITNYSEVDNSMAPDGHNSIVILEIESNKRNWFNLSPEEYKKQKEIVQNTILDKVEAITKIPLREKAEVLFSATPKTLKHYSSAPNGVMCGIATSIDQSFGKRTQPTTPIENLFLTGAFTSPPSVAGSLDSGISSGNLVLKVF